MSTRKCQIFLVGEEHVGKWIVVLAFAWRIVEHAIPVVKEGAIEPFTGFELCSELRANVDDSVSHEGPY